MTLADINAAAALQRQCFPPPFPQEELWQAHNLAAHLSRFPEGQFVAIFDDVVVGSATNLIVSESAWQEGRSWTGFAGGLNLEGHEPQGSTLFGLDICVSPAARGLGVGRALYQARFALVKQLRLKRFGTVCRLPGLAKHPDFSPETFVKLVVNGELSDTPLTPFLRMGMHHVGVVSAYMDDVESKNAGAKLEWTP